MTAGSYTLLMAQVQGEGAAYKVVLNGGVMQLDPSGRGGMGIVKLNTNVLEGEDNEIAVEVAPPRGAVSHNVEATFALRVLEGAEGIKSSEARVVHETIWTQRSTPAAGPLFMQVHSAKLDTTVSHGRWTWQDATPYSPGDRGDIEALVKKVHSGFSNANYSALAALTSVRDEEAARGLGLSYTDLEARSRAASQEWFAADDYAFESLDLAQMDLNPRAGGRLVEVTDKRGYPLLVGRVDGQTVRPPFTVSHLKDGWAVVR